jgi:hypothetical protein
MLFAPQDQAGKSTMTPQKLFSDALERVQLDPAIAPLPPIEQALKAAALLLMESPKDVFAKAGAQMNEAFPPRVHTATQERADLERLYPKGSDGKSSTDLDGERYIAGLEYVTNGGLDPDGHEDETNAPYYFGHSAIQAFEAGAVWQSQRSIGKK